MSVLRKRHKTLLTTTAILGTLAIYTSQAHAACPINTFDGVINGPIGAGGVYDTDVVSSIRVTGSGSYTNGAGQGVVATGSNPFILCVEDGGSITGSSEGIRNHTEAAQINNAGTITGQSGRGVNMSTAGTLINEETGVINGATSGAFLSGVGSSLLNAGAINGDEVAVYLFNGSSMENQEPGIIIGGNFGVLATNREANVLNNGEITSSSGTGIQLEEGGTVTNNGDGSVTGATNGVVMLNAEGIVTNIGAITAFTGDGINLAAGGSVDNQSGGMIDGSVNGVVVAGGAGDVSNAGTIDGTNFGVVLGSSGTFDNKVGGVVTGGNDAVAISGAEGTITNAATITSSTANGVALYAGGSVENAGTGHITGNIRGVRIAGGAGDITNIGIISGTTAQGAYLVSGGTVTNEDGGVISGETHGLEIETSSGTVTNNGAILGNTATGVYLHEGGRIENQIDGSIQGGDKGIHSLNQSIDVVNDGNITGVDEAIVLDNGGSVENRQSGTIIGGNFGVTLAGDASLDNLGEIFGNSNIGVITTGAGAIINQAGGKITGGASGVGTANANAQVTNAGEIIGNAQYGVWMQDGGSVLNESGGKITGVQVGVSMAGGSVTNQSGADITGDDYGVTVAGAEGTVVNEGTITGTNQASVHMANGGTVDNRKGGKLKGSVNISGSLGTVTNEGVINGVLRGVLLEDGGTVNNQSGAKITGNNYGVRGLNAPMTVNNAGSIDGLNNDGFSTNSDAVFNNLPGGVITGKNEAISIFGKGVVNNQGTINGNINFWTEDDTLHLMAGSSLKGDVDGNDGTDSLIVSGDHVLGKIINFENTTIKDGSVDWKDEAVTLTNLSVEGGQLNFAGGANNVTVGEAGRLSGTGKFGSLTLHGIIAPGNSAGTQVVTGDLVMGNTAKYEAEIYANGTSDLIDVGGSATLDGSLEIDIADAAEDYEETGTYTILTAAGGITGNFITTTAQGATTTLYAMSEIDGDDVNVNLVNPTEFFTGVGSSKNEKAASAAIAGVAVSSTQAQSLFYANSSTVNATLEELSGNSHATMANIIAQDGNEYMTAVKSEVRNTNQQGFSSWMKFYGMGGTASSDGNARGYKHDNTGVALGIGYAITPEITIGLHGGHTWSNATFNNDVADGRTKEFGAYVAGEYKQFNAVAAYSHGWNDVKMSRVISLAGTALSNADTKSNKFQLEASYQFKLGNVTVAPVVGYNRTDVKSMTIRETGAGAANLSGATDKFTSSQPKAGIRVGMETPLGDDGVIKPSAEVMYVSEQGDLNGGLVASSIGMPENSFTISGLAMDKSRIEVDAGVEYQTRGNLSFSIGYRGAYMSRIKSHGGRAALKIKF